MSLPLRARNLHERCLNHSELGISTKDVSTTPSSENLHERCLNHSELGKSPRKMSQPLTGEKQKMGLPGGIDGVGVVCVHFGTRSHYRVEISEDVRQCLRMPTFDNWQWDDEEILLLLQQMLIDLGFHIKLNIEIPVLQRFLYEVYKNYNEVPFHNFKHCFCVTQMMYGMACYVDLPQKVGDLEVLILLISCICHDLDHPGFNNIYQINARTELAIRYNDISPLENHHCSVAFRILDNPDCNIFRNLSHEDYKKVREGMIRCILATDMARHNDIINNFKKISHEFDYSDKTHVNLLCMILIKVADISNEARPMDVAEPWLDCLLQEFFQQSDLEKLEGLPVTPFMDPERITKPSSQCSFIGYVLLPLFETLTSFLPELDPLIVQPVREALQYYQELKEAAKEECLSHHGARKSLTTMEVVDFNSIKVKSGLATVVESVDINIHMKQTPAASTSPTAYLDEQEPPETEVEVAEKTVPFSSIASSLLTVPALDPNRRRKSLPFNAKLAPRPPEIGIPNRLSPLPRKDSEKHMALIDKLRQLRYSDSMEGAESPQSPGEGDKFPHFALSRRKTRAMSVAMSPRTTLLSHDHILMQKKKFEGAKTGLSIQEKSPSPPPPPHDSPAPFGDGRLQRIRDTEGEDDTETQVPRDSSDKSPSEQPPMADDIFRTCTPQVRETPRSMSEHEAETPATSRSTPASLSPRPGSSASADKLGTTGAAPRKIKKKKRKGGLLIPSCLKPGRRLSNDDPTEDNRI
ncbi:unnamed protein product [Cyprideis torosa]|uniref:Phosphodiesterase n=1 Tax=Cyprideis torosa TaxID=163714 RepID=A0A7R8W276_9CRUS|nr:unnamed protein product [Cyprideis torosa]CAG0881642.1 unnamed protein product [Cyprideis torosa]